MSTVPRRATRGRPANPYRRAGAVPERAAHPPAPAVPAARVPAATPVRMLTPPPHYDLAGTLAPLTIGRRDPAARFAHGQLWWTARTSDGPGTLHLRRVAGALEATGYGPGGGWLVDRADAVAGLRDDLTGFPEVAGRHPVVADLAHRLQGHRLVRTGRLFPHLIQVILAQKVSGLEAARGYLRLARHFGEPAPGPLDDLLLPPDPEAIAGSGYWVFHPFGVERKRADAIRRVALEANRLERCADTAEATRRLTAIPGIGIWTAAEVCRLAYGDPDAVTVGDYHLPHTVAWALAAEPRAGSRESQPGRISPADTRMLELLEPFTGHRARVVCLLVAAGIGAPRFGPRMPVRSFARF